MGFIKHSIVYHVYHFEKQKQLNREYGFENHNLHYFNEIFCIKKKTPIHNIRNKKNELQSKLDNLLNDLNKNKINIIGELS